MPSNTIHWIDESARDAFVLESGNPELQIWNSSVVQKLIDLVKANGDCIMVGSYMIPEDEPTMEHRAVYAVQLGDPMLHIGVCLGHNVGFLGVWHDSVGILQFPPRLGEWDMRVIPFADVERGVKVIVDTAQKCKVAKVRYGVHYLENIEHMLSRLLFPSHGELDKGSAQDYDFESPETWRTLCCSQLTLLVLKRCVFYGALEIEDGELREAFMSAYSHTCTPAALSRLISRTWRRIEHRYPDYRWEDCMPRVDRTPVSLDPHWADTKANESQVCNATPTPPRHP